MIWVYILIGLVAEFIVLVGAIALVSFASDRQIIVYEGKCPDCGEPLIKLEKTIHYCRNCKKLLKDEEGEELDVHSN